MCKEVGLSSAIFFLLANTDSSIIEIKTKNKAIIAALLISSITVRNEETKRKQEINLIRRFL